MPTTANVPVLPGWSITSGPARKRRSTPSSAVTFTRTALASAFTRRFYEGHIYPVLIPSISKDPVENVSFPN